ncbi:MAG: NINE protein [Myxococcales bacterium]|nr:NINE protein [Myxococcales bacterium]MCB9719006.1 NINE protein [Myxococcales bacterium]
MKDKNVAAILALFLGGIGAHKFYLGRIGAGILYLVFSLTFIPSLLGLIDFFVLALMDKDEFDRRFNGANMLPGPVVVNMLPPPGYGPGYGYGPPPYGQPYGAPPPQPMPQPGRPSRDVDQLKAELEKLNELRISGLLTEEEFSQQKSRLLGS